MPYNLQIPGQFTERELWAIEEVAKLVPPGGVVVEVGSSLGMSSYTWAKSVDPSVTVYCIDAWKNDAEYAQKCRERYQVDYSLDNFRSFTEKCPNIVTLQGFSPQDGEIIIYDFNKQKIGILKAPFPLRDIHQIQLYNSLLWVTCSFDNKVAIYDGKKWHEWFPNPEKKYDSNHFNSIYFESDYIYLVAHNIHRKSEVWKFLSSQENYCNGFNVSDIKFIEKIRLGTWSHNICLTDDDLYTCSSGELAIASKNKFFLKLGKFTRGLAVTDELIVVGLSELSERKQRSFSTSYIAVFDRKWNLINGLIMPEQGVVNELRIPGYKDYCSPFYLGKKIKMFSDNADLPRWKTFDNLKNIQN